jgi:hypothetical protein
VIEIDEGRWPLIVITYSGRITASELSESFATYDRVLAAEKPYVALVLVRDMQPWESSTIRRQVQRLKEKAPRLRRFNRGLALVLPSLWLKGLFRAVMWLEPMPQPYAVCSTVEEAMVWVGERLRSLGTDVDAVAAPLGV